MKKALLTFCSLVLLLALTAFAPTPNQEKQQNTNLDPVVYQIMEVAFLWDLLKEGYAPVRERDDTWLEEGLRSKYAMAKSYASITMVEEAFGVDVFVRGPHSEDMNFNAKTSFGYYNPAFIARLRSGIETALSKPVFKKVLKGLYENHLSGLAKTYHNAYNHLNKDEKYLKGLQSRYLMEMAQPGGIDTGSFQEEFRNYAEDLQKNEDANIYEAFTAPAFWLRRSIDGTDQQWFDLLDMVIKEMDKK